LVYQEFGNGNIEKDDQVNYDLSIVDSRQEELSAGDVVMDIWYDIFLYLEKIEMMVLRGVNSSFYIMLSDMLKKEKISRNLLLSFVSVRRLFSYA